MINSHVTKEKKQSEGYYDEFIEKFKPKKTPDDCYTPPIVYDAIKDWAVREYGLSEHRVIRPFNPGDDYKAYDYSGDCVVIDNPPFSILTPIIKWYMERGVKFFLFAPALTLFSCGSGAPNYVICDSVITYENGARIPTSFVTDMGEYKINVCAELDEIVTNANAENLKSAKAPDKPKYVYPDNIITAARLKHIVVNGESLRIRPESARYIKAIDDQRAAGKRIFGGGFIISEKAAAEKAAAEKAAAEKAAEKAIVKYWSLSDREKQIIKRMGLAAN